MPTVEAIHEWVSFRQTAYRQEAILKNSFLRILTNADFFVWSIGAHTKTNAGTSTTVAGPGRGRWAGEEHYENFLRIGSTTGTAWEYRHEIFVRRFVTTY